MKKCLFYIFSSLLFFLFISPTSSFATDGSFTISSPSQVGSVFGFLGTSYSPAFSTPGNPYSCKLFLQNGTQEAENDNCSSVAPSFTFTASSAIYRVVVFNSDFSLYWVSNDYTYTAPTPTPTPSPTPTIIPTPTGETMVDVASTSALARGIHNIALGIWFTCFCVVCAIGLTIGVWFYKR